MMSQIQGLTKISSTLERVWNAYQATIVQWFIWTPWEAAEIVPCVEEGVSVGCIFNIDIILQDSTLQHQFTVSEHTRSRRVDTGHGGLLNEDRLVLVEAGLCPYRCNPIHDTSSVRDSRYAETGDDQRPDAGSIGEEHSKQFRFVQLGREICSRMSGRTASREVALRIVKSSFEIRARRS